MRCCAGCRRTGVAGGVVEFVVFGLKQGWACLFGGLMLGLIIVSRWLWPEAAPIARYDLLVVAALLIQVGMLGFKLETLDEAKVILIFHVVGTVMEIFKTGAGSWIYPEPSLLRIGGVPLFSGFMYAAVGSYLARVTPHLRFPLHALSAGLGDGGAGGARST